MTSLINPALEERIMAAVKSATGFDDAKMAKWREEIVVVANAILGAASTPSTPAPVAISNQALEDALMPMLREHLTSNGVRALTYTSWRDGIDVERVTPGALALARAVLALAAPPTRPDVVCPHSNEVCSYPCLGKARGHCK